MWFWYSWELVFWLHTHDHAVAVHASLSFSSRIVSLVCIYVPIYGRIGASWAIARTILSYAHCWRASHQASTARHTNVGARSECEKPQKLKFTITQRTDAHRADGCAWVCGTVSGCALVVVAATVDGGVYRMTPTNWHAHYRKRIEHTKNNIIYSCVWMMNLTAIIVFWLGHKGVTLLPIGHEVFIYS